MRKQKGIRFCDFEIEYRYSYQFLRELGIACHGWQAKLSSRHGRRVESGSVKYSVNNTKLIRIS